MRKSIDHQKETEEKQLHIADALVYLYAKNRIINRSKVKVEIFYLLEYEILPCFYRIIKRIDIDIKTFLIKKREVNNSTRKVPINPKKVDFLATFNNSQENNLQHY